MKDTAAKFETICSHSDIAAYLDGELDNVSELRLEMHLAGCDDCFNALSEQKLVLCALNAALDGREEIELPVNFARKVAIHAESGVNGLRKREERTMAVLLCIIMFVVICIVAIGGGVSDVPQFLDDGAKMISSVGTVIGTVFYNAGLGMVVIVRTLTRYLFSDSSSYGFGVFCVLILSLVLFSSFYLRIRRFKF
jgi:predicted anti-sigma-YlaC factor YlaD